MELKTKEVKVDGHIKTINISVGLVTIVYEPKE